LYIILIVRIDVSYWILGINIDTKTFVLCKDCVLQLNIECHYRQERNCVAIEWELARAKCIFVLLQSHQYKQQTNYDLKQFLMSSYWDLASLMPILLAY